MTGTWTLVLLLIGRDGVPFHQVSPGFQTLAQCERLGQGWVGRRAAETPLATVTYKCVQP